MISDQGAIECFLIYSETAIGLVVGSFPARCFSLLYDMLEKVRSEELGVRSEGAPHQIGKRREFLKQEKRIWLLPHYREPFTV